MRKKTGKLAQNEGTPMPQKFHANGSAFFLRESLDLKSIERIDLITNYIYVKIRNNLRFFLRQTSFNIELNVY